MKKQFFLTSIFLSLLSACDEEGRDHTPSPNPTYKSQHVGTASTYATFNIISFDGVDVVVTAELKKGGSKSKNFIKLYKNDILFASVNEPIPDIQFNDDLFSKIDFYSQTQKPLKKYKSYKYNTSYIPYVFSHSTVQSSTKWYHTSFSNLGNNGDTFYISYERGGSRIDAKNSFVTLPYTFDILTPQYNDASYSRSSDDIYVSWSPANTNAAVDLSIEAYCRYPNDEKASFSVAIPDTGEYTIPANTISSLSGICTYSIRVDKVHSGHVDSHFKGGKIWGVQARKVEIETTD